MAPSDLSIPDVAPADLAVLEELVATLPGPPWAWAVLGLVLLLAGRRLFWVALGALGFVTGLLLAMQFLDGEAPALVLGLSLFIGLLAALLAVFIQKLAVSLGGFLVGGYAGIYLLGPLLTERAAGGGSLEGLLASPYANIGLFLIAGILGAILARLLFNGALIVVSALFGALLILAAATVYLPNLTANPLTVTVAVLALTLLGTLAQLSSRRRDQD